MRNLMKFLIFEVLVSLVACEFNENGKENN